MLDFPVAIIFDFDGIVVNSEPLHSRYFQEALPAEGIGLSEDDYYRELIGYDDRGAFRHILAKHHRAADERLFQRLMSSKGRLARELIAAGKAPALPGVPEFIAGLHAH